MLNASRASSLVLVAACQKVRCPALWVFKEVKRDASPMLLFNPIIISFNQICRFSILTSERDVWPAAVSPISIFGSWGTDTLCHQRNHNSASGEEKDKDVSYTTLTTSYHSCRIQIYFFLARRKEFVDNFIAILPSYCIKIPSRSVGGVKSPRHQKLKTKTKSNTHHY